MASRKDPKAKENQSRKPVAQKAVADTSGSNLADFKNKAVDVVTGGIAKAVLGPLSNMMSNQTARTVAKEVSGVADVQRFAKNPSVGNAGMVVLSAASYAAPFVKPLYAVKAANAARAAKALPVASSALTKTMKFTKVAGVPTGVLRNKGADLAVSGFRLAETAKPIAAVRQGRALAASQRVIQQGKQLDTILKTAAVTNVARQTTRATEKKSKNK
jgi:hypothetical protein